LRRLERIDSILIVSFLSLVIFPLLYIFRFLDDNTLTSWRWVFSGVRVEVVYLLIFAGIILSFFLSKSALPERYPLPFLFIVSFFAVMPLWSEPEIILDASRYFIQAKHLELYGIKYFFREWGNEIGAWTDMPVVPFFYGLLFRYLGETRLYIQIFNALLFSSSVALTYLTGRMLWDKERGFFAGMLLLGIPYLQTQVPLMLVDVPAMFLVMLSVFSFVKAIDSGKHAWVVMAAAAVFLALFSKYSVWLMLSVLPLIAIVYRSRGRSRSLALMAVIALIAGLLSGALFFAKYQVIKDQIYMLSTYQLPGLERWQESSASTFLFQTHPFISLLALFSVYLSFKKRDGRLLIGGLAALSAVVLLSHRARYILPSFPLLTLMASCGLNAIRDSELKRFTGFCIAITSSVIAVFVYLPFLNSTSAVNLKEAGKYLDSLRCGTVGIYALPQNRSEGNTEAAVPILDLFTKKRLTYYQDKQLSPAKKDIGKSPLRFTWEFKTAEFYSDKRDTPLVVVISDGTADRPAEWTAKDMQSQYLLERFAVSSGVFRYKTIVSIYGKDCLSRTGQ
jgi:4-amino-4-deoxy-L-arabinose transferase-like glycosyltransferase